VNEEILSDWNPWWSGPFSTEAIRRDICDELGRWLGRKEILALTGVRRGGKTTVMYMLIGDLLGSVPPQNILFAKCDDDRVERAGLVDDALLAHARMMDPKGKIHLFLDEVQEVPEWGPALKRLYDLRLDLKIIISGSSSQLVVSELATSLAGRAAWFDVAPFSFREQLRACGLEMGWPQTVRRRPAILRAFSEDLEWGGFPEVVLEKDPSMRRELLGFYRDSILLRDVLRRHKIRNVAKFSGLVDFLLANISNALNFTSIAELLGISVDSISEYVRYLTEARLVFTVPVYSSSIKAQLVNPKKLYCIDTGLRNSAGFRFSADSGRLLENRVFLELRRTGREIYYWKGKGEVDFIVKKGMTVVDAIQSAWDLNRGNREREIIPLQEAMVRFGLPQGTIVTENQEETIKVPAGAIKVTPFWKWALRPD